MKWVLNEPEMGDIVRVKIGNFYHYGIYVNDEEIIQFGLPPTDLKRDSSKIEVCTSNLEEFLCGNFIEIGQPEKKEKKIKLSAPKIVRRAKDRIGEKGYHILYNNCEHFAHQCAFGEKVSSQVEDAREMWKNFPFVNVYIEKFPFMTKNNVIQPKERLEEIQNCRNENVKNEKYYDWKLLEYGIKQSLGLDIKDVKFYKKHTKWICDDFEFSLSHSGDVVAVVVARNPVGIDVEEKNTERFSNIPQERILTQDERTQLSLDAEGLNKIWTAKEAIFKKGNNKNFNPAKVCTLHEKFITKPINVNGKGYYLTIATDDLSMVKYHLGDEVIIE